MERYAQKEEKLGFFSNVATVWPLLGLVDDYTGTFSGSKEPFCDWVPAQGPPKCQDRRIIEDKMLDSSQMLFKPLGRKGLRENLSGVSSGSKNPKRVYLETI